MSTPSPHAITATLLALLGASGEKGFFIETTSYAELMATMRRADAEMAATAKGQPLGERAALYALPIAVSRFLEASRTMTARVLAGALADETRGKPPVPAPENDLSVVIADALDHFIASYDERAADGKPLTLYEKDARAKVRAHAQQMRDVANRRATQREGL